VKESTSLPPMDVVRVVLQNQNLVFSKSTWSFQNQLGLFKINLVFQNQLLSFKIKHLFFEIEHLFFKIKLFSRATCDSRRSSVTVLIYCSLHVLVEGRRSRCRTREISLGICFLRVSTIPYCTLHSSYIPQNRCYRTPVYSLAHGIPVASLLITVMGLHTW
jgi:hypothetical protein